MSARFEVVTVTGFWLTERAGSGGGIRPGVSATVLDTAWNHEIATYRSERNRGGGGNSPAGRERTIAKAKALATKLNAEHGG